MHHLFPHAPPARVVRTRTHSHVPIPELAPHANHLHSFGRISLDEKFVSHSSKFLNREQAVNLFHVITASAATHQTDSSRSPIPVPSPNHNQQSPDMPAHPSLLKTKA